MIPDPQAIDVPDDFRLPGIFSENPNMAKAAGVIVSLIKANGGGWDYPLSIPAICEFLEAKVPASDERGRIYRAVLTLGVQGYFEGPMRGLRLAESFKSLFEV